MKVTRRDWVGGFGAWAGLRPANLIDGYPADFGHAMLTTVLANRARSSPLLQCRDIPSVLERLCATAIGRYAIVEARKRGATAWSCTTIQAEYVSALRIL